jgi:hypothetical protein
MRPKAMRITLIALTAVLVLAMPAVAEEPTGFAEFPWGTLRTGLIPICGDPLLLGFRGADELNCTERAPQIGEHHWTPTLRFDDGQGLGGYEIRVRPFAYRDLRDIAFAKFGRPADEAPPSIGPGERFNWRWSSGTLVVLYEHCGSQSTDDACLTAWSGTYSQMLNACRSARDRRGEEAVLGKV